MENKCDCFMGEVWSVGEYGEEEIKGLLWGTMNGYLKKMLGGDRSLEK